MHGDLPQSDVLPSNQRHMHSLLRIFVAFAMLCAGLCPAWCLKNAASTKAHSCCDHQKQKPCGQASAGPQAMPQSAIVPATPSLLAVRAYVGAAPLASPSPGFSYSAARGNPPPNRIVTVLRI